MITLTFFILLLIYPVSFAVKNQAELKEPKDVIKIFKNQGADAFQFPLPKECTWCTPLEIRTLNHAVEIGDIEVVEMLFAEGAILDAKKQCAEALDLARRKGRIEILKILIDHGAGTDNPSYLGELGVTLYQWGYLANHREVMRILIAAGADVNTIDIHTGNTMLIDASSLGWVEVVAMTLDKGADVNAINNSGNTAMHYIGGDEETATKILEMLLDHGADVNIGNSPLLSASFYPGYPGVIKMLLDHGAKVNIQNDTGTTPLMQAAFMGRKTIIKMLIDKGADINLKDDRGLTALIYSSSHTNTLDIINILLDHGANVNELGKNGETALIGASYNESPDTVALLLDRGATIDQVNSDSKSVLMYAAEYGRDKVVKVLLDRGAKTNLRDWDGQTALDIAKLKQHQKCIDILESHQQTTKETTPIDMLEQEGIFIDSTIQNIEDNPIMKPILAAQKDVARLIETGRIDYGIESAIARNLIYTRGRAISVLILDNITTVASFLRIVAAGNYDDEIKIEAKNLAIAIYSSGIISLTPKERDQIFGIVVYLIYHGATDISLAQPTEHKKQDKFKDEL